MLGRHLEQYTIADFLEFRASERLKINEDFQRRSIWKPAAKVYLIDSILRGMPIPKLYFRTTVDPNTQSSVREIVDGQQRLRAIFEFADDRLRLTRRAKEFDGKRYSDLDEDQQQTFLAYSFGAEQLINASDQDVLEVFARINTYTVALNKAELRHAEFQGDFKWMVHETAQRWAVLWEDFKIVSISQRARMADDALMAQMILLVSQGITDGGATYLHRAYKNFDEAFPPTDQVVEIVGSTITILIEQLAPAIVGPLANAPHFLMMFAAAAHTLHGIGVHQVDWLPKPDAGLPDRPTPPRDGEDWDRVRDALLEIGTLIEQEEAPDDPELEVLWRNSRGATTTTASRAARFPYYLRAFSGA